MEGGKGLLPKDWGRVREGGKGGDTGSAQGAHGMG